MPITLPLGLNSKAVALTAAVDIRHLGQNPSTIDKGDGEMGMVWSVAARTLMASVNEGNKFTYSVTGELAANHAQALTGAIWNGACDTALRQAAASMGG